MLMREAHFPGRAPIEAYGNGGFRFADMSHRGSILCVQSGIYGWPVSDPGAISADTLERVFDDGDRPELLLLGTGRALVPPAPEMRSACSEQGVRIEVMDTGAAVRTFNVLLAEQRSVAAALIAVE